jgi:hypothetical protein
MSRPPPSNIANLSSDDNDPTIHELSISKSLALVTASQPKTKQTQVVSSATLKS